VTVSAVIPSDPVYSQAGGPQTLISLRTTVRQECDIENDPHISDSELTRYINQSRFELYGLLTLRFEDYYTAQATIPLNGTDNLYPLPDGFLYVNAPAFFKGQLVEIIQGPFATPFSPVTLRKFNLPEKNRYNYPGYLTFGSPFFYPRYAYVGTNIMFTPTPSAGLVIQMRYAPKLLPLVNDQDVASDWNGWLEYVIIDACIKCLGKQERDPMLFAARKLEIKERLEKEAQNRDMGEPNTVSETSGNGAFGQGGPWGGGLGGGSWP